MFSYIMLGTNDLPRAIRFYQSFRSTSPTSKEGAFRENSGKHRFRRDGVRIAWRRSCNRRNWRVVTRAKTV